MTAPSPARRHLSLVPALDGLRGVAVAVVLAYHVQSSLVPGTARFGGPGPVRGGFLGVDVFFVLSGFLVTALLLGEQGRTGGVRLGAFYRRRAWRLLPALYLLLVLHAVYAALTGLSLRHEWMTDRAAVVSLSNWTWRWDGLEGAPGMGHLWSLAVEGQFYLTWPLVVVALLGLRRPARLVVPVLVLAIVVVAGHRLRLLEQGEAPFLLYLRTDTRLDALLVGALLAQLWVRGLTPRRWLGPAATAATVLLLGAVVGFGPSDPIYPRGGYTAIAVCAAVVVLAVVEGGWVGGRLLATRSLRALGLVSYELYLWHLPLFDAVNRLGTTWSPWARVALALPLSLAAAVVTRAVVAVVRARLARDRVGWDRSPREAGPVAPNP